MREYWLHSNGDISDSADCAGAGAWCIARRVVVIDPEDREAVDRISEAIKDSEDELDLYFWERNREALRHALYEFANPKYVCPSALVIAGKHYPCQQMDHMATGSENHDGWAHSNRDAEAIWSESDA